MVHFIMTYAEAVEYSLGKWIDPQDYKDSPWMLCHTGQHLSHKSQWTRVDSRVTCPQCAKLRFAHRVNPSHFNFSPMLTALVGAIIGHDYGVRDSKGGHITSLYISSDGYVFGTSTASASGAFITDVGNLYDNLKLYKSELSADDKREFERLYAANVKDWRA